MFGLDNLELAYVLTGFIFQAILIAHFAVRRWRFALVARHGWLVYALSLPAAVVSLVLLWGGKPWTLWLGGFLYLVWAVFGYVVEFVRGIQWRNPPRWSILGPYLTLYLATTMFYWWPLAELAPPLWYLYALLFVVSTLLNLASHGGPASEAPSLQA